MNSSGRKRPFLTLLDQRQIKAGFLHLFGSHSLFVIFLASLTIITLNWFSDGIWLCASLIGKPLLSSIPLDHQVQSILVRSIWFPLILFSWWLLIRKSFDSVANLIVRDQIGAPACKVLIFFLSPPGTDLEMIRELLANPDVPLNGEIRKHAFRKRFLKSWRMLIEAVHFHLQQEALERIMIIPSATVRNATGKINEGTFRYFQEFKHLVEKLTPAVSVHRAGEADEKWMEGVDYESAQALRDCLADIFQFLLDTEGYREEDILLDITAGQKLCSSIGTLLSLQRGRQIQYVSTSDYTVKSYNIDYEKK